MSTKRPMAVHKVLVVDDHLLAHQVLGAVARAVFRGAKVLFAQDLHEALQLTADAGGVDLVLLDLGLPGRSGIDALAAFRERFPSPKVIVVSATEDRASVVQALEASASGYVPKTHAVPLVAAALRVVAEGGTYVPPQALRQEGVEQAPEAPPRLTKRRRDVLRLIVQGLSNKQIARQLRIGTETVKHHASAVYAALRIASRREAARAAERRGIKLD